jgi:hypothetical protein
MGVEGPACGWRGRGKGKVGEWDKDGNEMFKKYCLRKTEAKSKDNRNDFQIKTFKKRLPRNTMTSLTSHT